MNQGSRAGQFQLSRIRPWSWPAFLLGALAVGIAAALQIVCGTFGAHLYFAAFLPSIFLVAIFAGTPAASFAIVLSVPLVWWAFIPPFFEFSPLSLTYAHDINLFFLFGVLLIGFADLCRETIAIVRRHGFGGAGERAASNSQ